MTSRQRQQLLYLHACVFLSLHMSISLTLHACILLLNELFFKD
jgi:hypothetical protein